MFAQIAKDMLSDRYEVWMTWDTVEIHKARLVYAASTIEECERFILSCIHG